MRTESGQREAVVPTQQRLPAAIEHYFSGFNRGHFAEVAALFEPQGQLIPPIDPPLVGPEAIRQYLQQEAVGMTIEVDQQVSPSNQDPHAPIKVGGQVRNSLFSVNVAWTFGLAAADPQRLAWVKVDLLASWEELFSLRPTQA